MCAATDSGARELAALYRQGADHVAALGDLLQRLRAESPEVAERKWAATLAHLIAPIRARLAVAAPAAPDPVAALELSRALGDLYLREVVDEFEAELGETPPGRAVLVSLLRDLERHAEDGVALADALFRAALDHIQTVRSPT